MMSPRNFLLNIARRNRVRISFDQDSGRAPDEVAGSCRASRAAVRRKRRVIKTVGPLTRNRGFESISLQRRVYEPSVPLAISRCSRGTG
jgi:hypothetical protein